MISSETTKSPGNSTLRAHPWRWCLALMLGLGWTMGLPIAPPAIAAPQPAPVAKRWQLDIRPGPLRIISLETPETGLRTYFYFTYTVVNTTGEDLVFAPTFDLAAGDGSVVRSNRGVAPAIYDEMLKRLKNPFLKDEVHIVGTLMQGEENGQEGLVIWPADDLKVTEVTIYAAGFSGESKTIPRPDTGEPVMLRKTLMLRHAAPGDISGRGATPLERTERRWVMR